MAENEIKLEVQESLDFANAIVPGSTEVISDLRTGEVWLELLKLMDKKSVKSDKIQKGKDLSSKDSKKNYKTLTKALKKKKVEYTEILDKNLEELLEGDEKLHYDVALWFKKYFDEFSKDKVRDKIHKDMKDKAKERADQGIPDAVVILRDDDDDTQDYLTEGDESVEVTELNEQEDDPSEEALPNEDNPIEEDQSTEVSEISEQEDDPSEWALPTEDNIEEKSATATETKPEEAVKSGPEEESLIKPIETTDVKAEAEVEDYHNFADDLIIEEADAKDIQELSEQSDAKVAEEGNDKETEPEGGEFADVDEALEAADFPEYGFEELAEEAGTSEDHGLTKDSKNMIIKLGIAGCGIIAIGVGCYFSCKLGNYLGEKMNERTSGCKAIPKSPCPCKKASTRKLAEKNNKTCVGSKVVPKSQCPCMKANKQEQYNILGSLWEKLKTCLCGVFCS